MNAYTPEFVVLLYCHVTDDNEVFVFKRQAKANKGVCRGPGSTFDSACSLRTFAAPHSVLLLEKPGMPSSVGTEEDTINIT